MNRILILLLFIILLSACTQKMERTRGSYADASMNVSTAHIEQTKLEERQVTYQAKMTIMVDEIEGVGDQIVSVAKSYGGYLLEGNEYYVRVRVGADSLEGALDQMAHLGKVTHRNVNGRDVTDYKSDLNLRLNNAEKTRDRYLALLDQAEKVSEILLIEKELERISLDIERYKSANANLETNISYSDVTVTINEKVKPGPIGYIFVGLWKGIKFLFVRN